ncbi:helix-turn-helix domain-containing protein [Hymenobacter sp. YC55]|uniref:helix-turn-helix domain-containing protein n=1 Tax=Hymenobacter sp. YC55 TaxID=3034019 RepID=UPI0023F72921|nr:helix-turn-helix domain-containing protein [Hymenobacter sp. YC55]MDF7811750.1 helix-turn-helix domain-containing protein [Hymenobacter sp. YC55]
MSVLQEQFIVPPRALQQVLQYFVLLTVEEGAAPVVRTLLPTFQIVMLINLGPTAEIWHEGGALVQVHRVDGIVVTAPLKKAFQYRLPENGRVLAVNFTLEGFFRLFQVPVEHLTDDFTDPDDLLPHRPFAQLWQQLRLLHNPTDLVQAIVDFSLPYLRALEKPQAELMAQLPLLAESRHLNPLKVMAAATKVSERTWQLRFQKYLGFSVKEASRFMRFRRLLGKLEQRAVSEKEDWLALLEQHGYYDQSHLIHDFTHFLQQSPTKVSMQLLQGDAICFTRTELVE